MCVIKPPYDARTCSAKPPREKRPIVTVDVDAAYRVSADEDVLYINTGEHGCFWYYTITVDFGTGRFVASPVQDFGPFRSERAAKKTALARVTDWMHTNTITEFYVDPRLQDDREVAEVRDLEQQVADLLKRVEQLELHVFGPQVPDVPTEPTKAVGWCSS